MTVFVTIVHILIIALAAVTYLLYLKHRETIRNQGYARGFQLLLAGIFTITCVSTLDLLYKHLPSNLDGTQTHTLSTAIQQYGTWIGLLAAPPLLFAGLAMLINQLIPKTSRHISQLEETQTELTTSNDRLTRKLTSRNKELETSNTKLREVLRDQQVSRLALLQSEKKFRTLFDSSPAIFASVNENQTLIDINLHGAKSLGYDTITLVGKPFTKLVTDDDVDSIEDFISNFFDYKNKQTECEIRLQNKNRSHLWVKITGSLIEEAGSPPYLLLVCQDITTLKSLEHTLSFQARHDSLTGLKNRYALEAHLDSILTPQKNHTINPFALLYIDVDQLKVVNDTCGYLAGDELLKQLANAIQESASNCDCLARLSGDEFVIVKDCTTEESAIELAEIVRNAAEDFIFLWEQRTFRLTVSIGVALSSSDNNTITAVFAAANEACYSAKQAGRNRVHCYEEQRPEKNTDSGQEILWVGRLQEAFSQDKFDLYFQPIMLLGSAHERYVHYEVLIRYIDDNGTVIGPDSFLPAAERFGLSEQLDLWVLTTTLDFLSKHPSHVRALNCCSINLTAFTLASHRARSAIRQLIGSCDFPAHKICFEITETNAIRNLNEVIDFIRELKILGCKFALDDFGTGFSSFGYLKKLDIDYIKIDGSFIRDILSDTMDRAIVRAINTIGTELGIHIIAEYVENNAIAKELVSLNIHRGQGYGLSKPKPLNEIHNFYNTSTHRSEL